MRTNSSPFKVQTRAHEITVIENISPYQRLACSATLVLPSSLSAEKTDEEKQNEKIRFLKLCEHKLRSSENFEHIFLSDGSLVNYLEEIPEFTRKIFVSQHDEFLQRDHISLARLKSPEKLERKRPLHEKYQLKVIANRYIATSIPNKSENLHKRSLSQEETPAGLSLYKTQRKKWKMSMPNQLVSPRIHKATEEIFDRLNMTQFDSKMKTHEFTGAKGRKIRYSVDSKAASVLSHTIDQILTSEKSPTPAQHSPYPTSSDRSSVRPVGRLANARKRRENMDNIISNIEVEDTKPVRDILQRSLKVQRDNDKTLDKATRALDVKTRDMNSKIKEILDEFPQNNLHELLTSRELRSSVAQTRRWMRTNAQV